MEEDLKLKYQQEFKKQENLLIQKAKEEKVKMEEEIKLIKTEADKKRN